MKKVPTIDCDTPTLRTPDKDQMMRRGSTLSKLSECLEGQVEYKDLKEFAQEVDFLMGKVDSIHYEFHLNNGLFLNDDASSNKSGLSGIDQISKPGKHGRQKSNISFNGTPQSSTQDAMKKAMQAKNFEEIVQIVRIFHDQFTRQNQDFEALENDNKVLLKKNKLQEINIKETDETLESLKKQMALVSDELHKKETENMDQQLKIRDLQDEKFNLQDKVREGQQIGSNTPRNQGDISIQAFEKLEKQNHNFKISFEFLQEKNMEMQAELSQFKLQNKEMQDLVDEKEGLLRDKTTKYTDLQLNMEIILTQAKELQDDNEALTDRNEILEQQKIELEQKLALEIEVNCQFEEEPDSFVDEDQIEQSSVAPSNNLGKDLGENKSYISKKDSQTTFSSAAILQLQNKFKKDVGGQNCYDYDQQSQAQSDLKSLQQFEQSQFREIAQDLDEVQDSKSHSSKSSCDSQSLVTPHKSSDIVHAYLANKNQPSNNQGEFLKEAFRRAKMQVDTQNPNQNYAGQSLQSSLPQTPQKQPTMVFNFDQKTIEKKLSELAYNQNNQHQKLQSNIESLDKKFMDAFIPELQKLQQTVEGQEATVAMLNRRRGATPTQSGKRKKQISFDFSGDHDISFCLQEKKQEEEVKFQFQTELSARRPYQERRSTFKVPKVFEQPFTPIQPYERVKKFEKIYESENEYEMDSNPNLISMATSQVGDAFPNQNFQMGLIKQNEAFETKSAYSVGQLTTKTKIQDKGKKEFFKLVVLSVVMNQPPFMLNRLYEKDWREMYKRSERDKISFNHYFEWVTNDINKCIYSYDDFIEMDQKHRTSLKSASSRQGEETSVNHLNEVLRKCSTNTASFCKDRTDHDGSNSLEKLNEDIDIQNSDIQQFSIKHTEIREIQKPF